jgi:hypothetical protein
MNGAVRMPIQHKLLERIFLVGPVKIFFNLKKHKGTYNAEAKYSIYVYLAQNPCSTDVMATLGPY